MKVAVTEGGWGWESRVRGGGGGVGFGPAQEERTFNPRKASSKLRFHIVSLLVLKNMIIVESMGTSQCHHMTPKNPVLLGV